MTLPRTQVVAGLKDELTRFEEVIRSLDQSAWSAPSRCEGWSAGDVAAHVTGGFADITAGRFDGLGTPEVTQRQVTERRGRTPAEVADELLQVGKLGGDILDSFDDDAWAGPAPAGLASSLGVGVEALWYDAYLHNEDIRAAAGLPQLRGPGLRAAVEHVADILTTQGWGPATLAFDGMDEVAISGGGRRITGDALEWVLAATGRSDPAALGLDETVNVYREI